MNSEVQPSFNIVETSSGLQDEELETLNCVNIYKQTTIAALKSRFIEKKVKSCIAHSTNS